MLVATLSAFAAALVLAQTQQVPIEESALDHRDQWGVSASIGGSFVSDDRPESGQGYAPGLVPILEVGVSRALGELSELQLRVRIPDDPYLRPGIFFGYRGYTGEGPLTTFYEADAVAITGHDWAFGARVGVGLQWDPVRWWGLYGVVGFLASAGAAFDLMFDFSAGAQFRF